MNDRHLLEDEPENEAVQMTVLCPDTDETVTIDANEHIIIRKEELSRYGNWGDQFSNYGSVLTALLSEVLELLPRSSFYIVLFSVMASDLTTSNPRELMFSLVETMPLLITIAFFFTLVAVTADFFIKPAKYKLRNIFKRAIYDRCAGK